MTRSNHHLAMRYIDAHVAHLRASGYSPRTVSAREDILRRLHSHLPDGLLHAATDEIDQWLATPGWSAWTRCTYAAHIRAFYAWATRRNLLDGDPAAEMARPRTPRCTPKPVTDEELARALQSPDPWYTIILVAAAAGLRASEIAQLRREDVTEDAVNVRRGKGGDPGMVPCHPALWAHIEAKPTGPLILHQGRPVSGRWISAHARHHFDAIGLPQIHLHRLRHTFATMLYEQGADPLVIQQLMRHRSVTSTQVYTAVRSGKRRLAINTLPIPTRPLSGSR